MSKLGETHRTLLERWRHAMNLVGPGPVEEHFVDCAEGLAALSPPPSGRWADLGSGAGFPGLVFADRYPEVQVELVESRHKRASFLRQVVGEAAAPRVRVRCERVEGLPARAYDGIMARAYAPPPSVIADAERLLVPGGRLALWVGADAAVELGAGWSEEARHRYVVGGRRHQVVIARWTERRGEPTTPPGTTPPPP